MNLDTLALYAVVSFFYILSPGPAVLLVIYKGALLGKKPVVMSALGNISGLFVLSAVSMLGLSTLMMTSSILFTVVKFVGAGYLIYLGLKQLWASRKKFNTKQTGVVSASYSAIQHYKQAFLIAVTNPKPILFFGALFPQFINVNQPVLTQFFTLTFIFMLFSFLILLSYGSLAMRARGLLDKSEVNTWFQRITGGIFVSLGVGLSQLKLSS